MYVAEIVFPFTAVSVNSTRPTRFHNKYFVVRISVGGCRRSSYICTSYIQAINVKVLAHGLTFTIIYEPRVHSIFHTHTQ